LYTGNRAKLEGVYKAFSEVYGEVELVSSDSGLLLKDQPASLERSTGGCHN